MVRVYDNGSRPALVIFDLDGTLYPREAYVEQVLAVIARMFVELSGLAPEAAWRELADLRRDMQENWDKTSTTSFVLSRGFTLEQWRDYRVAHMSIVDNITANPGLLPDISRLRHHVRTALLTNNTRDMTTRVLDKIGFGPQSFDAIVSSEDAGPDPKPHPAAFVYTLSLLGIEADGAWAIGDRYDIDVEPLRRLGGSGLVVSGPEELPKAIAFLVGLSKRPIRSRS